MASDEAIPRMPITDLTLGHARAAAVVLAESLRVRPARCPAGFRVPREEERAYA
jgi:hypothetical protein